jgi:hypothetical protein
MAGARRVIVLEFNELTPSLIDKIHLGRFTAEFQATARPVAALSHGSHCNGRRTSNRGSSG